MAPFTRSFLRLATAALTLAASPAFAERIVIAGDSTASDYPPARAPQMGWGQALPYFAAEGVEIVNLAVSGRSTKSYIDEGKWAALRAQLEPGDVVLISFGHNDSRDDAPERYAAPFGAYEDNLERFAKDVRAAGGVPVIVTSAARRLWEGPAMVETHGLYRTAALKAADDSGSAAIDLASLSVAYFEGIGREGTKRDFLWLSPENANQRFPDGVEDNTHFTELGACGVAFVVMGALKAQPDHAGLGNPERLTDTPSTDGRPDPVVSCAASLSAERALD
jgi:lysophospholipase L1-like esterase